VSSFEKAWTIVKGYEPPTITPLGAEWLQMADVIPDRKLGHRLRDMPVREIGAFRNLASQYKNRPMMSVKSKMMTPEGKNTDYHTLAVTSAVPLDEMTRFNIRRAAQDKMYSGMQRNKHADVYGMIDDDLFRQMLFEGANPQDLLDFDVTYDNRGYPLVLDDEGRIAPTVTYRPFDYVDGERVNPRFTDFVLTEPELDDDNSLGDIMRFARMIVPNKTKLRRPSVVTPYGAAFPNTSIEELMREIGGTRI
tara:strand:+ start:3572 stop:4321 length:750 start_codon:yes stop_codon:yes gene_type:complete